MKTAKRKFKRDQPASPIRAGLNALQKEIEAAAEALGYDTSKPNWRKHIRGEGRLYPCTLAEDDQDLIHRLRKSARTRLRAIELIDSFSDLLPQLEGAIEQCDEWRAELRDKLAAGPLPLPVSSNLEEVA
jgi:hypothetical protein